MRPLVIGLVRGTIGFRIGVPTTLVDRSININVSQISFEKNNILGMILGMKEHFRVPRVPRKYIHFLPFAQIMLHLRR